MLKNSCFAAGFRYQHDDFESVAGRSDFEPLDTRYDTFEYCLMFQKKRF